MMNLKFKSWLRLHKDSERTIELYYKYTSEFFACYSDINQENVDHFFLNLLETKQKSTVNIYNASIKAYLKFIKLELTLPKIKKLQKKPKDYLSEEEMYQICDQFEFIFQNYPRYLICFKFMFYTGLRISEMNKLKREDIDLVQGIVTISETKNYELRQIPLYPTILKDLQWYFKFEKEKNNAFNLYSNMIKYMFQQINEQYNPAKKVHAHMMRHSFAKWLYHKTNDIYAVKEILGHKDINTTLLYLKINIEEIINKIHKIFKKEK